MRKKIKKIKNRQLQPINRKSCSWWRNTKKVKSCISTLDLERMRKLYNACTKSSE